MNTFDQFGKNLNYTVSIKFCLFALKKGIFRGAGIYYHEKKEVNEKAK